jgi:C-terminal processing protease CtpA/Prc
MRQTASLNVAHTRVSWPTGPLAFRQYPLAFYWSTAFYWYEVLPDARALYIQYNCCANTPGNSFASFARNLFASADTQALERVVVDLRGNGGGDSSVMEPLLDGFKSRPALSAKGHLYVLIGRGTCSSGMMAALSLWHEFRATLLGEPTGGKPNAYGDVRTFSLPNSRLVIRYSTKRFQRMTTGDPPSLNPDVRAPQSLSDCLAGRDPALAAALHHTLR